MWCRCAVKLPPDLVQQHATLQRGEKCCIKPGPEKRKGREIRLENTWEIDKMSESIKIQGEEKQNASYGWDNS